MTSERETENVADSRRRSEGSFPTMERERERERNKAGDGSTLRLSEYEVDQVCGWVVVAARIHFPPKFLGALSDEA